MTRRARVIVVGGGPAGAASAWGLASLGHDVLVLDKARFPRDKACAEYLSPEASRILDAMGVLGDVEAAGAAQLAGMTVRAPGGGTFHGEFAARHGFRGFRDRGLALRRRRLDPILLDGARRAGAELREGVAVVDVRRDAAGAACGVRVRDADGALRDLDADLVIGADGLRSVVGRRLALASHLPWPFPRRIAFVAHWRGVAGVGAHGEMHVERDGYVGIADVGHGETNVAIVVPRALAAAASGDTAGFMARWLAAKPQLAARFAGAERCSPVRTTGPFAARARRAWAPGALLAGDAADFFDPFTGEGIFAALRGGELLAPFAHDALRARSRDGARRALAAYDAERRRVFGGKWLVERMIGTAVAVPALMDHAARTLGARRDMADLLIGVAGDIVPAREVLRPGFLLKLLAPPARRST
jgi:2-polyprenyl-6-methoxyphenol hydroxylase-like FAD-dependent oxidoreductase